MPRDLSATNLDVSGNATFHGRTAIGSRGTQTQTTDRTTTVVLSTRAGTITTTNTSLAAVTIVTHTVTNTLVNSTDVVVVSKVSGDADTSCWVDNVSDGSFDVSLRNNHASAADTTAFVYNFVVIGAGT